jgi:hypothetical protein
VKYALYIVAAFAVGLGIGKHAQLGAAGDAVQLQRCMGDLERAFDLLLPPPLPKAETPATPIIVPALDDAQEGEIV